MTLDLVGYGDWFGRINIIRSKIFAIFRVAVIGAGMGGLNAAVQLKHAGSRILCDRSNEDVGGTWFENRYPGARG